MNKFNPPKSIKNEVRAEINEIQRANNSVLKKKILEDSSTKYEDSFKSTLAHCSIGSTDV